MNEVVLVTGASKGLGRGIVKEFAKNGYNVVINYLNDMENALKLKNEVEGKYNIKALCIKCDISDDTEVQKMIEDIFIKLGNIDVLINNVGISIDSDIFDKNKKDFMRVLEVNNYGTFLVSREVIRKNKVKTIINISSTDSIDTYNELNTDYSMSKAGINILTKTFALKYKSIKICALAPNFIDTDSVRNMNQDYLNSELSRVGQKRLLSVEEVSTKVFNMVEDINIKCGDIIRMDGDICA